PGPRTMHAAASTPQRAWPPRAVQRTSTALQSSLYTVFLKVMGTTPAHGPLSRVAERVIHRVVQNSAFFYYARTHFYWGTMKRVRRTLDLQPGERLLDVGCGSGMGAGLTTGTYVGVDAEMTYLRFASGRLRARPTHSFACMSARRLAFGDRAFDKAMMLNLVHHLDEATLDGFLRELRRVVRK